MPKKRQRVVSEDAQNKRPRTEAEPVQLSAENDTAAMKALELEVIRLRTAYQNTKDRFDELSSLRNTETEKHLAQVQKVSEARHKKLESVVTEYKSEIERLKSQFAEPLHPNSKGAVTAREHDLEAQLKIKGEEGKALRLQIQELQKAVPHGKKKVAKDNQNDEAASINATIAQKDQQIQRLQKELDFEVENSKRLAGQSKQPNSVSTLNNIATKSSNDVVQYKEMLNLAADLTGLLVSTSRETPEGKTYDCIMSDLHDFGLSLAFKLTLHPNAQVSFQADFDRDRDEALTEVLPECYLGTMRFEKRQITQFFRKLWKFMNVPVEKSLEANRDEAEGESENEAEEEA